MPKRTVSAENIPVVPPRQPCPCGSGKRYKVCHGKAQRAAQRQYVARPFEGLPNEPDWVAMRELISAATAPVTLSGEHADRDVVVATLLPGALPALVRDDGTLLLGLQTATSTGDPSADLGHVLSAALSAEPGSTVEPGPRSTESPRLQDLVAPDSNFEVTVHNTFEFWLDGDQDAAVEARASLESANESIVPAAAISGVEGAYWCSLGDRDQIRWVLPYAEEPLLDAFARLHARGQDTLGEGTRLLGMFRASGLLAPVWDLVEGTTAEQATRPVHELRSRLAAAFEETAPLGAEQRRARQGLANRQVTVR